MKSGEKHNHTKTYLAIIAVLVGIIIFLLINGIKKEKEIIELRSHTEVKFEEIQELEGLVAKYDQVVAQRESLGLENDALNAKVDELREALQQMKEGNDFNLKKRKELKQLLNQMQEDLLQKDLEINKLLSANDSLSSQSKTLVKEKKQLGDSLVTVVSKKSKLESKLAEASILKTESIRVSGYRENDKELPVLKLAALSYIKIHFSVEENRAATRGNKTFYLRLMPPSGDVFSEPLNGGGRMKIFNGLEIPYTLKVSEYFDNSHHDFDFVMPKGFDYVSGEYYIEIFADGYPIGDASFIIEQ